MLDKYHFRWLYASDFTRTTDYYARSLREKVLPAFDNIPEEGNKVETEAYEQFAGMEDPEGFDEADVWERAQDVRIRFYETAYGIEQGITNMFTAGLYHLFEQQLYRFHRQQLLSGSDAKNPKLFNLSTVQECLFQQYRIDIFTFPSWSTLEELQLVANTVKHGDGRSCAALKNRRPDLFHRPGFHDNHDGWPPDFLSRRPVYQPLAGEDIYITPEEFSRYVDATKQFWEELATAVEQLPY